MSPLDPSIPLSVRPFQGVNILAIQENQRRQEQEARLAEQDAFEREKYAQERQTLQDQAASRKILGEALRNSAGPNGIDRQKLMQSVPPEYLLPISEQLDKLEQSSVNMQKTRLEAAKLQREEEEAKGEGVRSLGGLIESLGNDPEAWQTARHIAANSGGKWGSEEDLAPFDAAISQDPSKVASIAQVMKNYRMRQGAQKNEDFTLSEGQIRYGPGGQVIARGAEKSAASSNPTQASLALAAAKGDEAAKAALQMLTAEGGGARNPTEASLALAAAGGDEASAKAFRMLNAPKPGEKPAKPATASEKQTLAFYNRASGALDDIERNGLETKMQNQSAAQAGRFAYAPDYALNADQRQYRQAQRAFTEARLRKESGAAINPTEYANDARTYFAQPNDDPGTIAQKKAARERVLNGLKFASGKAYEEYYGEPNESPAKAQPDKNTGGGGVKVKAPNGKTYTFPSQQAANDFKKKAGIP